MKNRMIIGVKVAEFAKSSNQVQEIFKDNGCSIRTRIGLHDVNEGVCDPKGIILIEFIGDAVEQKEFVAALTAVKGVIVKTMTFDE
ncbi:MAG: hypothetical protein LBU65_10985 [Planctomycetaceae bacterium]|nr:hypothetical protein [Planctomycetaceae bacterium]